MCACVPQVSTVLIYQTCKSIHQPVVLQVKAHFAYNTFQLCRVEVKKGSRANGRKRFGNLAGK